MLLKRILASSATFITLSFAQLSFAEANSIQDNKFCTLSKYLSSHETATREFIKICFDKIDADTAEAICRAKLNDFRANTPLKQKNICDKLKVYPMLTLPLLDGVSNFGVLEKIVDSVTNKFQAEFTAQKLLKTSYYDTYEYTSLNRLESQEQLDCIYKELDRVDDYEVALVSCVGGSRFKEKIMDANENLLQNPLPCSDVHNKECLNNILNICKQVFPNAGVGAGQFYENYYCKMVLTAFSDAECEGDDFYKWECKGFKLGTLVTSADACNDPTAKKEFCIAVFTAETEHNDVGQETCQGTKFPSSHYDYKERAFCKVLYYADTDSLCTSIDAEDLVANEFTLSMTPTFRLNPTQELVGACVGYRIAKTLAASIQR